MTVVSLNNMTKEDRVGVRKVLRYQGSSFLLLFLLILANHIVQAKEYD